MAETGEYFDTPLRRERMQLLVHLLANAEATPYLRAPAGAGKTRFLAELRLRLLEDYRLVSLIAGGRTSLRAQLAEALGIDALDAGWPEVLAERLDDRPLLLLVDDAQALDLSDIADLLDVAGTGGRLLLAGTGELARAASDWEIHFVDLPPFSEDESRAFLRHHMGPVLDDTVVRALHRASGGQPGLLLDGLDGLGDLVGGGTTREVRRVPWGWVSLSLAAVLLLGAAWYYQDRINAWFEPAPDLDVSEGASAEVDSPASTREVADPSVPPPVAPSDGPESAEDPTPVPAETAREEAASNAVESPPVQADPSSPPADTQAASDDPVLDAIIDEAIRAAAQPPEPAPDTRPSTPAARLPQVEVPVLERPAPEAVSAPPVMPAAASGHGPSTPPQVADVPVSDSAPTTSAPVTQETPDVTTSTRQAVAPAQQPASSATKAPPPPAAAREGMAWLLAQPPEHWTLQLVGSRERASIDAFLRRHRIPPPHAVFERRLDGQPWYSLVAGSYPSRDAAVAARARLPAAIARSGVWPRTFASVREQMQR